MAGPITEAVIVLADCAQADHDLVAVNHLYQYVFDMTNHVTQAVIVENDLYDLLEYLNLLDYWLAGSASFTEDYLREYRNDFEVAV